MSFVQLLALVAALLIPASARSLSSVVQVIDTVLLPPQSVVDLAVATPDLSTLVTAVQAAGLVSTLSGPGPFTVFAPTNEAFAKLPSLYLQLLLDPKNIKTLQKLLTYHVVESAAPIFSRDLANGEKIATVEGQTVTVTVSNRKTTKKPLKTTVKIDDATVTTADVAASNGVVHIVDTVLMPPDMPPMPPAPPPGNNHLYFVRVVTAREPGFTSTCGQVDAGPRVPQELFQPQNKAILDEYIQATITGFAKGFTALQQTSCLELGYSQRSPKSDPEYPVQWGPDYFMTPLCRSKCDCSYTNKVNSAPDACKDVPDDPAARRYCSLCGPKYNKPMPVEIYLKPDGKTELPLERR